MASTLARTVGLNLGAIFIFAILYLALARMGTEDFVGMDRMSSPLDALYLSMTVQSTIGFGDITPKTTRAKLLVMMQQFVVIVGIVNLLSGGGISLKKNNAAMNTISNTISNVPAPA
ncbi:hypothetical protein DSLPV1_172 [Dishui lake phycodnavirus 1]|uniref:hypothetical protein n=1 Tax=Dishui lake phycodnavirus 1 TaxID=2079134 RepID=UPI000CD692D7|nr:hypothetical protein C5Y57_gp226 [Dishui lake phycodnavirus 1]AUT19143.1 hypothetical protein DSLPV1_172 [Dishui lake phycodnavirus 1]